MFPFNLFPYTNFHDINMDWIIKTLKTLWTKSVFTVNNTPPDAEGNVNLAGVSGVTAVDGVGADGAGNVNLGAIRSINSLTPNGSGAISLVAKPSKVYYAFVNADFTANLDNGSGNACWRCGIASIYMIGTIKAGASYNTPLVQLPNTIPDRYGEILLTGKGPNNELYQFRIDSDNKICCVDSFSSDTNVVVYGTYITAPNFDISISAP